MDLNPFTSEKWLNVNQKMMAKYMNNGKNYETYFEKFHYFKYFYCFNEAEKNMDRGLEFISILQFSQMHLIFEINVSKDIKMMIAKNCKKL